jgi:hypothetical protein
MTLISTSIPNLINGVSQQPPSIRLVTQAEKQENGLSSVVDGLVKRPPTEHKNFFITGLTAQQQTDFDKAFIHPIRNSDNSLHFLTIQKDGTVTITDSTGTVKSLTNNGSAYISGLTDPSTELTATTVADFTFLVNKTRTVAKTAATSPVRNPEALVYVAKADYSVTYTLTIVKGGVTYTRSISTMASVQSSTAGSVNAEKSIQTDRIASNLRYDTTTESTYYGSTAGATIAGLNFTLYGNVIHIHGSSASDTFTVSVTDSRGGEHLRAFKGETPDFKKLPTSAPNDFVILVSGDNQKGQDDFYVKFTTNLTNGQSVWKETIAPGVDTTIDPATMPHTITYDGTAYTFGTKTYSDRKVGDDNTNAFPSFIGEKLNDVFFHRNRLGFLADENVIFSEAGEYFNFFNKTVLTLVDSAPIDVAVSNNQVSILRHAVPFNESLILYSDFSQFKLSAEQLLTPETVTIDVTTRFEASLNAKPKGAGRYVYFPTKTGSFSGLREYYVDVNTETNDASEVTAHIPSYIDGTVKSIAASTNEDMVMLITDADPTVVYPYKFYYQGNEKLQSAWSKWRFSGKVRFMEFDQADVFFVTQYDDKVALERMNLSTDDALNDTTFPVLLDRRVKLTGSDTLPYTDATAIYVTSAGSIITAAQALTHQSGGGTVYAGVPYNFIYRFSQQVFRNQNKPITTGRLQLKNMAVVYADTGFFNVEVVPHKTLPVASRKTYTRSFTGRVIGSGTNIIGSVPLDTGTYRFGLVANAQNAQIELQSNSHLPCSFQSAEVEAEFVLRSQRM